MRLLLITTAFGLAACTAPAPEPIYDASVYHGGKGAPVASLRPAPKPRWADCPFGTDKHPTGVYRTDIGPDAYCDESGGSIPGVRTTNEVSEDPPREERPKPEKPDDKPEKPSKPKPEKPSKHKPEKPSKHKPEKPSKHKPEKPSKHKPEKPKGNASANNGKGGNYDKTGHSDNGKGQGRNKK